MPNDKVYIMPANDQMIRPVEVVDLISDQAEDVTSLVRTHEARQHMATATKYLRWAAAAERQNMGAVS